MGTCTLRGCPPTSPSDRFPELQDEATGTEFHRCIPGCSHWGCGCPNSPFLVAEPLVRGCLFYAVVARPTATRTAYEAFHCTSWDPTIVLRASLEQDGSSSTQILHLQPGMTYHFLNVSLAVTSADPPPRRRPQPSIPHRRHYHHPHGQVRRLRPLPVSRSGRSPELLLGAERLPPM
jgi:hypothetical protein